MINSDSLLEEINHQVPDPVEKSIEVIRISNKLLENPLKESTLERFIQCISCFQDLMVLAWSIESRIAREKKPTIESMSVVKSVKYFLFPEDSVKKGELTFNRVKQMLRPAIASAEDFAKKRAEHILHHKAGTINALEVGIETALFSESVYEILMELSPLISKGVNTETSHAK